VSLEAIEQAIEHESLPLVDRHILIRLPESRLPKYCSERGLSAVNRSAQAAKKPVHPWRHVECALLSALKNLVIVVSLLPNLRRHAVEALRALANIMTEMGTLPRLVKQIAAARPQ
jgi:hypothetical protein